MSASTPTQEEIEAEEAYDDAIDNEIHDIYRMRERRNTYRNDCSSIMSLFNEYFEKFDDHTNFFSFDKQIEIIREIRKLYQSMALVDNLVGLHIPDSNKFDTKLYIDDKYRRRQLRLKQLADEILHDRKEFMNLCVRKQYSLANVISVFEAHIKAELYAMKQPLHVFEDEDSDTVYEGTRSCLKCGKTPE